eukprot:gb/GECH01001333.1/.p1 GENE.gb/GECH01001333.1/~~gb/GECH01001333.1/.p1  ORF type:complete len:348 (+),score=69.13 gb/GECH01001333.1/:1-1044(+)
MKYPWPKCQSNNTDQDTSHSPSKYAQVVYLSLAAIYALVLLLCIYIIIQRFRERKIPQQQSLDNSERPQQRKSWSVQHTFLALIPWAMLARVIGLLLWWIFASSSKLSSNSCLSLRFHIIIGGLPGYIFFSVYILLVFYWAQTCFAIRNLKHRPLTKRVHRRYILIVAGVFFMVLLFYIAVVSVPDYLLPPIHCAEILYATTLSIAAAIAAVIYGYQIHRQLRSLPTAQSSPLPSMNRSSRTMHRVDIVTILCTVLFVFRALLTVLTVVVIPAVIVTASETSDAPIQITLLWMGMLATEVVPTILMVWVLCGFRRIKERNDSCSRNGSRFLSKSRPIHPTENDRLID